jgi:hypothetical protein
LPLPLDERFKPLLARYFPPSKWILLMTPIVTRLVAARRQMKVVELEDRVAAMEKEKEDKKGGGWVKKMWKK